MAVLDMQRSILPAELFQLIEWYMNGECDSINVLVLHKRRGVIQYSAGAVPRIISANDSNFSVAQ